MNDEAIEAITVLRTAGLFIVTAVAEILGCYLPYLWLRQGKPAWLLAPAVLSLALFSWLLTLHPTGAARTYAAYGGVYVATALAWLWLVERQRPTRWDLIGALVAMGGMAIIVLAPRARGPQEPPVNGSRATAEATSGPAAAGAARGPVPPAR